VTEWREILDFPGYLVSEFGTVQYEPKHQYIKTRTNQQGFSMVGMTREGRQQVRSVGKLVAQAFVDPEHHTFNTIIHLNGDRADCRAFNLKWRSRPFAIQYHRMFETLPIRMGVYIPYTGERFYSLREACTKYGMIESIAYRSIMNKEPTFPYGWLLEPDTH
jgi:hypothetical protein